MKFFTANDLDFFSSVMGRKFEKNENSDTEFKNVGDTLKHGVYAKTDYWSKLIEEEGYSVFFKYHWQNARRIRRYTWAQIYLEGFENAHIYFTVGVGYKRTSKNKYVTKLEYKLDCKVKEGLSRYQNKLFDAYLDQYDRTTSWKSIDKSELDQLSWDRLKEITLDFIEQHEEHYKSLVNLVWPYGVGVAPKIARVCWNTLQWKQPSGEKGKSNSKDAFEKDKGYGYEEWLLDLDKQIDGHHYGFLQAFNKGDHEGKIYDVQLYTIENDKENKSNKYFWVGRLPYLEILTKEEKDKALQMYKDKGWYDEMLDQLKEMGVPDFNFEPINEEHIFNVKYKVDPAFHMYYDPLLPIKDPNAEIGRNRHYVLLDKPSRTTIDDKLGKYVFKEGHNPAKSGIIQSKSNTKSYQKNLLHQEIQTNIYKQLKKEYLGTNVKIGTEVGTGKGTSIDLVISDPEIGDVFYEIKTGPTALACIREAMGQIIEYCYYSEANNAIKLIIVSPHALSSKDERYLCHLRKSLSLLIYYQKYSKDKGKLEANIF